MIPKRGRVRHTLRRGSVVAVATLTLLALVGTPSQAAGGYRTVDYSKSWTFRSSPRKVCVFITASGYFTYTTSTQGGKTINRYWKNQTLTSPRLSISVVVMGTRGVCGVPKKLTSTTFEQHWAGYSCSYNPSISLSFPWGLGVSAWPSCGNREQGSYSTQSSVKSSTYTQDNTGAALKFGDQVRSATSTNIPCYGVFPIVVVSVGPDSDKYDASTATSGKVCLPF